MRWFKHLTDAWTDEAMAQLIDKFGLEGYGLWWRILEIIGSKMEKGSDKCSVQYSVRKWQNLCGIYHRSRFNLMIIFLQSLNKLDLIFEQSSDDLLTISCPNLLKFRDEYSRKSGQTPDKLQKKSGQCQEQDTDTETETKTEKTKKTMPESGDSSGNGNGKKHVYQKDFEQAWLNHGRKDGSKFGAEKKWLSLKRLKQLPDLQVILDAQDRQKDSKKWREGYCPYFETWLNKRLWEEQEYEHDSWGECPL